MEENKQQEVTLDEIKRQAAAHQEDEHKDKTRSQLIVFKLGDGEYGIPIDQIKEVVLTPPVARVPQTPDYIQGVANIRGNVIAIMDLRIKFGLSEEDEKDQDTLSRDSNYTLVIEDDVYKVGILVKEVPNTLNIYESDIDSSTNVMQFSSLDSEHIRGIVNLDGRLIILVDIISMMQDNKISQITT